MLYPSPYFKQHREEYSRPLQEVRTAGSALRLHQALLQHPIITASRAAEATGLVKELRG